MLPGVGFSLLFGNLWYAWMARKLAGYDNRTNVTAHPYGVNTPAGLLMTFNVVFTRAKRPASSSRPSRR